MQKIWIGLCAGLCLGLWACGGKTTDNKQEGDKPATEQSETKPEANKPSAQPSEEPKGPSETPLEFPSIGLSGLAVDDYAFFASGYDIKAILNEPSKSRVQMVLRQVGKIEDNKVWDAMSKNKADQAIPDFFIIPASKGAKVQKGDVLLAPWTAGSMGRAIVVDASKPNAPKVRFMELGHENPAKDQKSGKSVGQTDYDIEANQFVKLKEGWERGNRAVLKLKEFPNFEVVQILSLSGDKVLVLSMVGQAKVVAKGDLVLLPNNPGIKAGDEVMAAFGNSIMGGKVVKVMPEIGQAVINKEVGGEAYVPFGLISKDKAAFGKK